MVTPSLLARTGHAVLLRVSLPVKTAAEQIRSSTRQGAFSCTMELTRAQGQCPLGGISLWAVALPRGDSARRCAEAPVILSLLSVRALALPAAPLTKVRSPTKVRSV